MRPARSNREPQAPASGEVRGEPRALNLPRAARVRFGGGAPVEVNGEAVESLRESWLVEDRWWTPRPLRRRYWEVVTTRGRNVVVFRDLTLAGDRIASGGWFVQGS